MKKVLFTVLITFASTYTFSQTEDTSLRKHIVSVEAGLIGGWINYERHLGGLFTIKSHVGLDGGAFWSSSLTDFVFFTPTINVEPRYYYSFNRRVRLEKKTTYNAANYFGLSIFYVPSLFTISNVPWIEAAKSFSVIPKYGIKRTIGKRINFEFALGPGVAYFETSTEVGLNLDLRFGYNLK